MELVCLKRTDEEEFAISGRGFVPQSAGPSALVLDRDFGVGAVWLSSWVC